MQIFAYRVTTNQLIYMKSDEQVHKNCQTPFKHNPKGCPNYKKNWSCPPHAPTIQDTRASLQTYPYIWIVVMEILVSQAGLKFLRKLKTKKKNKKASTYLNTFMSHLQSQKSDWAIYFCSHCELCPEKLYRPCTCPAEPCRYPKKIRISPEAAGIDLFATMKGINVELEQTPTKKIHRITICATDERVDFNQVHQQYKLYLRILGKFEHH